MGGFRNMGFCKVAVAGAIALLLGGCAGGASTPDAADVMDAMVDVQTDPGPAMDLGEHDANRDFGEDPIDVASDDFRDDKTSSDVGEDDGLSDAAPDVSLSKLWDDLVPAGGGQLGTIVGVASHMNVAEGEDAERDFEFSAYKEFSNFRIRRGTRWNNVEPAQDEWHMERVSAGPTQAAASGVRFMPLLAYGNKWAQDDPEIYGTVRIDDYADYAGHMAATFCETTKDYEIWNEQNVTRFWHVTPNPEKYADLLIAASIAIRAACPDARVVFGGITSYDDVDMWDRWGFLRRALEARPQLCDSFDAVALHPYTWFQYETPEHDEVMTEDAIRHGQTWMTQIARDILADAGCGGKSLLFTELGWPTYDLTDVQVARFAVRSLLLAARDGVEGWYWYTFWDDEPESGGIRPHENYFGLWRWPGKDGSVREAKPAWHALKAADAVLGQYRFARDLGPALGLPNDVYALAFVDNNGDITLALWDGREMPDVWLDGVDDGGPDTTFALDLPLPDCATGTRLRDMMGAECDSGPGGMQVALTLTPEVQYLMINCGPPADR